MSQRTTKIIMFTGKGGVGKSTMSVATALKAARQRKTLIVSTDPSGSLAELLHTEIGDEITSVAPNLDVVELTRKVVLHLWRQKFADEIYAVLAAFLPVEKDIIDYLEGAPGIDEEFMLDYVLTLHRRGTYDLIVWDTAPTTTTLNLLFIQQLFYRHLTQAQKLYLKLKSLFKQADPVALIRKWLRLTEEIVAMLQQHTSAWVVSNPERLPVEQALMIADSLEEFGISVNGYLLNKNLPVAVCRDNEFLASKLQNQQRWQQSLRSRTSKTIIEIPELAGDASAREKLLQIAAMLPG
jgi:arsenite-transporting ATPase